MHAPDLIGTTEGVAVERWNRYVREMYGVPARVTGDRMARDGSWSTEDDLDRYRFLWCGTLKTSRAGVVSLTDGTLDSSVPGFATVPQNGILRRLRCNASSLIQVTVEIRTNPGGVIVQTLLTNEPCPFDYKNLNYTLSSDATHRLEGSARLVTGGGVVVFGQMLATVDFEAALRHGA